MFGRYTFSKAPFAGQGSNAFTLSLTEDASLGDAPIDSFGYTEAPVEVITSEDTNAQQNVYYFGNVDDLFTSQDTLDIDVNYPASFSDGVTCDSTIGITAQFAGTVTEALTSLEDIQIGSAYFDTFIENFTTADDPTITQAVDRSISEGLSVASTQTITAHFVVSRSDAMEIAVHLETFGWIKIQTHTTSNWTPVDDAQ